MMEGGRHLSTAEALCFHPRLAAPFARLVRAEGGEWGAASYLADRAALLCPPDEDAEAVHAELRAHYGQPDVETADMVADWLDFHFATWPHLFEQQPSLADRFSASLRRHIGSAVRSRPPVPTVRGGSVRLINVDSPPILGRSRAAPAAPAAPAPAAAAEESAALAAPEGCTELRPEPVAEKRGRDERHAERAERRVGRIERRGPPPPTPLVRPWLHTKASMRMKAWADSLEQEELTEAEVRAVKRVRDRGVRDRGVRDREARARLPVVDWTPVMRKRGADFARTALQWLHSPSRRGALSSAGYGMLLQQLRKSYPRLRLHVVRAVQRGRYSVLNPNQGSTLGTLPANMRGHILYRCPLHIAVQDVLAALLEEPELDVDVTLRTKNVDEDFETALYVLRGGEGVQRVS